MMRKTTSCIAALLLLISKKVLAGESEFEELLQKMENDVLELAHEAEQTYQDRCLPETLDSCYDNNYEECMSEYPDASCPGGIELRIPACGDGTDKCGGLFDYTISTTRIPEELTSGHDRNPENYRVRETVCYTRGLDEWFIQKHSEDLRFWEDLGVESPSKMYGARDGIFRIYPGRHSRTCGEYDARKRPWYISATSGPKNIVLVLDTSGSMSSYRKLDLLKIAASQIVSTLTVADRVAIVQFSKDAQVHGGQDNRMLTATKENKDFLLKKIKGMEAKGETNFEAAFNSAFETLENSISDELHVDCNTAILFLTDGKMTTPVHITTADILKLVTDGVDRVEKRTDHPVLLFTYSVSEDEDNVLHDLPQKLACSTKYGVWSKIVDEDKLVESLTNYYVLFAVGLGHSSNEDFVAWVEPYKFYTNDQLGTTASAPVYDRTVHPHILIGVAGYTFSIAAFDEALGVPNESQETLDKIVRRSTARCPNLEFSLCQMESFRKHGTFGEESLCFPNNCTDYVEIEPGECPSASDFPYDVWNNGNFKDRSYEVSPR